MQGSYLNREMQTANLTISDLFGRKVYQTTLNSLSLTHTVNLSHAASGMYYLLIEHNGSFYTKLFMIN